MAAKEARRFSFVTAEQWKLQHAFEDCIERGESISRRLGKARKQGGYNAEESLAEELEEQIERLSVLVQQAKRFFRMNAAEYEDMP